MRPTPAVGGAAVKSHNSETIETPCYSDGPPTALRPRGLPAPARYAAVCTHPMNDSHKPLICAPSFEPWLCELRGGMGGCPEGFVLCGADVTEVAVAAFDVVEVVDVVGHCTGQFQRGRPSAGVEQLDLHPGPE
jgi:hypothetical protein